jgi:hypothetical protein
MSQGSAGTRLRLAPAAPYRLSGFGEAPLSNTRWALFSFAASRLAFGRREILHLRSVGVSSGAHDASLFRNLGVFLSALQLPPDRFIPRLR